MCRRKSVAVVGAAGVRSDSVEMEAVEVVASTAVQLAHFANTERLYDLP